MMILLTSCFQYEEEMVLKKDGSGEVTIRFVFGRFISSFMDMDDKDHKEIKFRLKNSDGLKILDENVSERRGRRVYEVTVQFDNYRDLRNLDIEAENYDDDIDMDVKDFFEDISFDGENFTRRIEMDHDNNDKDEVPRFVTKMVDVEFFFSLKIEGKNTKEWTYDLNDLVSKDDLVMKVN